MCGTSGTLYIVGTTTKLNFCKNWSTINSSTSSAGLSRRRRTPRKSLLDIPPVSGKKKKTRHSAKRPPSGNPSHDTIRYLSTPPSQKVDVSSLLSKICCIISIITIQSPQNKMCEVGVLFRFFIFIAVLLKFPTSILSLLPTRRIIPVSKWLGSPPFYKP